METVKVNLTVKFETQKAILTNECGWIPKSVVIEKLTKNGKTTDVVGVSPWIVAKNTDLKNNADQQVEDKKDNRKWYEIAEDVADQRGLHRDSLTGKMHKVA